MDFYGEENMRSGLFREEQTFSAEIGSFCGLRS